MKNDYLSQSTIKGILSTKALENYEKAVKLLDTQIQKGFIKNRQFGMKNGKTFMQTKFDREILLNHDLDVSIIIKRRGFDTPPYLNF